MLHAALNGELDNVETYVDPIFGLHIPKEILGVPSDLLNPRNTWKNSTEYDNSALKLATMFFDESKNGNTKAEIKDPSTSKWRERLKH